MGSVPLEGLLFLAVLLVSFYIISLLAVWNLAQERERKEMRKWLQEARDEELDRQLRNVIRKANGQREIPRANTTYAYANAWGMEHSSDHLELAAVATYLEEKEKGENPAKTDVTH